MLTPNTVLMVCNLLGDEEPYAKPLREMSTHEVLLTANHPDTREVMSKALYRWQWERRQRQPEPWEAA